jgi:hypothetical protein
MFKEISIFNTAHVSKTLTRTERSLLFNELAIDSNIPKYHFESFEELENSVRPVLKSNIPALLLKRNIKYFNPIIKKTTSPAFSVLLQTDEATTVIDESNNSHIIPSNDQIKTVGVLFRMPTYYYHTPLKKSSLCDRIVSGTFGLYEWVQEPHFDGQKFDYSYFQSSTYLKLSDKKFKIMFKNEDHALKTLEVIDKYVQYIDDYYNDSLGLVYTTIHLPPLNCIPKNISSTSRSVKLKQPRTPLFKLLDEIYTNNLLDEKTAILHDIINGGLWNLYQAAKFYGLDSPQAKRFIEIEKKRQDEVKSARIQMFKYMEQKNKHYKLLQISRDLFHKETDQLTKEEREAVNLTYAKDLQFAEAVIKNKCRHLALLEKTMKTKYFDPNVWDELKKIIPLASNSSMLKCNICDLIALCPHHYDRFEYSASNVDENLRNLLIKKYAGSVLSNDAFYCKICGERIVKKYNEVHKAFEGGERVHVSSSITAIDKQIWKEVRNIIGSNIAFNITTDVNTLTTSIVYAIQDFIEEERTKQTNIKTNSNDKVQNMVYLFINIYTFASLVRIMGHNPNDMEFKKYKTSKKGKYAAATGGNERVDIKLLQSLLKAALTLIISTKQSLIKKIPHISNDSIKPLFVAAFKNVSKMHVQTFTATVEPEFIANNVIYNYLYFMHKKFDPSLKYSNVRKIIGVELQDVSSLDNIIDKATIPGSWGVVTSNNIVGALSDINFLTVYNNYAYRSAIHFVEYAKNKLHTMGLNTTSHKSHKSEYMELKNMEDNILKILKSIYSVKADSSLNESYGKYNYQNIHLARVYCNSGLKHKFNIHVYEQDMTRLEISKKNIDEWMHDEINNKNFIKMKASDLKCSLCGVLLSSIKHDDLNDDISNILNRNDEIRGFYNLYMFKCPVGKTHKFKNDTCIQCNVTKTQLFKNDISYYEKYKIHFDKEIAKQNKENEIKLDEIHQEISHTRKEWEVITTSISALSRATKISTTILNNIGAMEGEDYEKIIQGEKADTSNQTKYLIMYMNNFLIEYEMLKNGRITHPYLEKFAERWNVDFSKFPDIFTEYRELFPTYNTSKNAANFVLHSLSKSLLNIINYPDKTENEQKAAMAFVQYTIDKIVSAEKSMCSPGILRGKVLMVEDDVEGDAVEVDEVDGMGLDDGYDPFGLDDVDVDPEELAHNTKTIDN